MDRPTVTARAVARGASWAQAGQLVAQAIWFGSLVLLAAIIGPAAVGLVTAGLVVVSTAQTLLGAGTTGALVAAEELDAPALRHGLLVTGGGALLASVAVALASDPVAAAVGADSGGEVLRALMIAVVLTGGAIVPMALLQRSLRFRERALLTAGGNLVGAIVAVAAAVLADAGVWALVLRQVVAAAILSAGAWTLALRATPALRQALWGRGRRRLATAGASWFLLLEVCVLVAINVDFVVVGNVEGEAAIGILALAHTLGLAPLTQVSWQIGKVLFPATAALGDAALVARRTLVSLQLMALGLLPLVPVALALAPWLIPAAMGEEWEPMVVPFALLFVAGTLHGIANVIGESLAGTGSVRLHATIHMTWTLLLIPTVIVLVLLDGVRGAALAHLIVVVPLVAGYLGPGARRLGLGARRVAGALAPVAVPVLAQGAVTLAVATLLADHDPAVRALAAAAAGAVVAALGLLGPLRRAGGMLSAMRGREATA